MKYHELCAFRLFFLVITFYFLFFIFWHFRAVPSDYCVWEYDKAAIIQKVKQEVTKDFGQSDQNKVSKGKLFQ